MTVALAPPARVARAQLIGPVPAQVPWLGVAETNPSPAASVSVRATPVAVVGPLLVTVIVYVRLVPRGMAPPGFTVTPTSARSGMTEAPATDQFVAALNVSDMGTLAAPTLVLPNPRPSPAVAPVFATHCCVCEGPAAITMPLFTESVSKTI